MIAAMFVVCIEQPSKVHCADNCCLVNFEDEAPRLCYSILVMMRDISSASRACGGTLAQKKAHAVQSSFQSLQVWNALDLRET